MFYRYLEWDRLRWTTSTKPPRLIGVTHNNLKTMLGLTTCIFTIIARMQLQKKTFWWKDPYRKYDWVLGPKFGFGTSGDSATAGVRQSGWIDMTWPRDEHSESNGIPRTESDRKRVAQTFVDNSPYLDDRVYKLTIIGTRV